MKPSEVIAEAVDAVNAAFPAAIEVEGRIVARATNRWTSAAGRTYQFVNLKLADLDATGSAITLSVSTTVDALERILSRSGLDPQRVTAEGEQVVISGNVEAMKNTAAPQLRLTSIAPTGLSADMRDVQRLATRITDERLGHLRHEVLQRASLVRRIAIIGTQTGRQDVLDGMRQARHLPRPATCFHEIAPQSSTSVIDVPRLIAEHVDAGTDSILIAFGGHLDVPSPWDTEPIVDAIVHAHRHGIAVLAGFAHTKDKPLAKSVAFDLKQASAAGARIVQRNDERIEPLLRLDRTLPALEARHQQAEALLSDGSTRSARGLHHALTEHHKLVRSAARGGHTRIAHRHLAAQRELGTSVATAIQHLRRTHTAQLAVLRRVATRATTVRVRLTALEADLQELASDMSASMAGVHVTHQQRLSGLSVRTRRLLDRAVREARSHQSRQPRQIVTSLNRTAIEADAAVARAASDTAATLGGRIRGATSDLRAISLVAQMLESGWAIVSNRDGTTVTSPGPGDVIDVRTVSASFSATVNESQDQP